MKRDFERSTRMGGKQQDKWVGPFVVTGETKSESYFNKKANSVGVAQVVNGANLKKFIDDPVQQSNSEDVPADDTDQESLPKNVPLAVIE